jgi:glycosyltransferase involved in cell wall biosynthesis
VHFPGRIDTPQSVLGLMDVFALSSNTEQMPISILEAMATGLPIAGLAVGDVLNMVAEPNRPFIAPKGDEDGLLRALLALTRDSGLRQGLGEANRAHVRATYGEEQMIAAHGALMLNRPL